MHNRAARASYATRTATTLSKLGPVVVGTVWVAIHFEVLPVVERCGAHDASEVLGVPRRPTRRDTSLFHRLRAATTLPYDSGDRVGGTPTQTQLRSARTLQSDVCDVVSANLGNKQVHVVRLAVRHLALAVVGVLHTSHQDDGDVTSPPCMLQTGERTHLGVVHAVFEGAAASSAHKVLAVPVPAQGADAILLNRHKSQRVDGSTMTTNYNESSRSKNNSNNNSNNNNNNNKNSKNNTHPEHNNR
jgi:hypothetical protein